MAATPSTAAVNTELSEPMSIAKPAPTPKPNPFDPATLRIDRNSAISSGPKELITRIGIGRPHKQDYIRVHPDPAYQVNTRVVLFKENEEYYLIQPDMLSMLWHESVPVTLHTAMKYPNALFVWPRSRAVARSVHGGRCGNGARRDSDRHISPSPALRALGRHQD